jgi:hypothetical protein
MRAGDIIGGRFQIEGQVGRGGMGEVYRASDRASGEVVAIKIRLEQQRDGAARFTREAEVLSEISHPGIVRYVAHGETPSGEPYLAMEWLDGEDLKSRLRRAPLTVEESIALGVRVAGALGAAHARGVVHRDIKPSNVFLVRGRVQQAKVLDFGIAWRAGSTQLTRTGMLVGTPGFMAPEQARNSATLDARTDVFSLGCVLFRCLTGAMPFGDEHLMAVLAKILHAEAPQVRDLRPAVPEALSRLVDWMLSKDPDARPRDASEVAAALEAIGPVSAEDETPLPETSPRLAALTDTRPAALTDSERRVLSVVLLGRAPVDAPAGRTAPDDEPLRRAAEQHGGRLDALADGSTIATIAGEGRIATDRAAQAARCALALRALCPGQPMALAMGRAKATGTPATGTPATGDVIDRGARLLAGGASLPPATGPRHPLRPRPAEPGSGPGLLPIALDEVSAALLDARFEVVDGDAGPLLLGERELTQETRRLLGKPTSFVGRDFELSTLQAALTTCVDESSARAVVVTAPAGMGKSRLASEVVRWARTREDPFAVWLGRGDSLRTGSTLDLLGQALRAALSVREGEPLEVRRSTIEGRVAEHVPLADRRRVAEFLGELTSSPFADEESAPLRAARHDAELMSEQMQRAWVDFLRAETAAHPVLLVLEDLHWGDLATVRFVDTALCELADCPFVVLSLARPEAYELFPKLWERRRVHEVRLRALSKRASERLARQVLDEGVEAETIDRLVQQADGNAFYLEELIRTVAEGKRDALPETVLAMVEARLSRLDRGARRVLRAASILGEVFWEGAVTSLLGGTLETTEAREWITMLVEREVLVERPVSRFPGERELAFRHALLRDGAYAMLTEEDARLGHRLAGAWLEQRGEPDPMVLAGHFERGAEGARASVFYQRAAEQASRAVDVDAALARAERGLGLAVDDAVRVALLEIVVEALIWSDRLEPAEHHLEELTRRSSPGSGPWAMGVMGRLRLLSSRGRLEAFIALLRTIQAVQPSLDGLGTYCRLMTLGVHLLDVAGRVDLTEPLVDRAGAVLEAFPRRDPYARGWFELGRMHWELYANEDPWATLRWAEAARASFGECNHRRFSQLAQVTLALCLRHLGVPSRAEDELGAITLGREHPLLLFSVHPLFLAGVLADRGALEEARLVLTRLVEDARAQGMGKGVMSTAEGKGRWALADVLVLQGEIDAAEREARASIELLAPLPTEQLAARATLAAAQLAHGSVTDALASAKSAMDQYRALGVCGFLKGATVRLVHAEALHAADQHEAARVAIAGARDRVHARAARIDDPSFRRSFLTNVPEHARTLALAHAWLGEAPTGP